MAGLWAQGALVPAVGLWGLVVSGLCVMACEELWTGAAWLPENVRSSTSGHTVVNAQAGSIWGCCSQLHAHEECHVTGMQQRDPSLMSSTTAEFI